MNCGCLSKNVVDVILLVIESLTVDTWIPVSGKKICTGMAAKVDSLYAFLSLAQG